MAKQNKVAVNLVQDFTDAEKAQARSNISAAAINEWTEKTLDTTKTDSSVLNLIASFGDDGCIGYYFDNGGALRLTWWHNEIEAYPQFYIWSNNGYTYINRPYFQTTTSLGTNFLNSNGQHNTLRWKLSTFRCVDFHLNPFTNTLYWKEDK